MLNLFFLFYFFSIEVFFNTESFLWAVFFIFLVVGLFFQSIFNVCNVSTFFKDFVNAHLSLD